MSYMEWKQIPGYDGKYEASFYGQVRRICKKNAPKMLTPYKKCRPKGSSYLVVKLTKDGKSKEVKLSKLIYETFVGPVPNGYNVVHKDASFTDNSVNNLIILTKEELGKMTGHKSKHKPVLKCTADLVPIEAYRSAREAAKMNYMSYQTVIDRCNGKVKSLLAPDGFVYVWDKDCYYADEQEDTEVCYA